MSHKIYKEQSSYKEMEGAYKSKIFVFIIFSVSIILLMLFLSNVGAETVRNDSKQQDIFIRHDSASSDLYQINETTFKKVFYAKPRYVEFNNSFVKFTEYINISENTKGSQKSLKLETLDGEICYLNLNYELENKSKTRADLTRFNIEKRETNYYFTSEISDEVTNVSYQIDCKNSYFEDETLVLMDEIKVDFKQARQEQNISAVYNEELKKVELNSIDGNLSKLKLIDPVITYDFNNTPNNISAFHLDRFTGTCTQTVPPENTLNPNQGTCTVNDVSNDFDFDFDDTSRFGLDQASTQFGDAEQEWLRVDGNINPEIVTITQIEWNWTGCNSDASGCDSGNPDGQTHFYLWNFTSGAWFDVGSHDSITEANLSFIRTDVDDFVNSSNKLHFLTLTEGDTNAGNTWVDYISLSVTYSVGDTIPPYFTTIPNNITLNYSQGFGIDFDATDDIAFGSFFINWTTFFQINQSGFLQNSSPNLGINYYEINVSINDSEGNQNYTIFTLNISKGNPLNNMLLSGTTPITYGTSGDFQGSETNIGDVDLTYQLFRNGQIVSNPDTSILGVGLYEYEYNTTGGENWTSGRTLQNLTINQATPTGDLINQTSLTLTYGSPFNFTISESNSGDDDLDYQVFRDGVDVTSEAGLNRILAGGTYNYSLNSTEGANYSSTTSLDSFIVTINKANSEVATYLNGTRGNKAIVEGLNITVNGSLLTGVFGTLNLTIDGVQVNSSTSSDLTYWSTYTAGTYLVNTSYLGNENYTIDSEAFILTVSSLPYFTILNEFPLDPATYSPSTLYNFNVTPITTDSIDTVLLEFNGVNYTTNQSYSFCHQETANESTGCGAIIGGNYVSTSGENWYDGNLNSRDSGNADRYTNYTKPSNLGLNSLLETKVEIGGVNFLGNYTITNACMNYNLENLSVRVFNEVIGCSESSCTHKFYYYCFNGTWDELGSTTRTTSNSQRGLYEESIWWNISDNIYSTNIEGLSAGDYNYTWYANDSNVLHNTTNGNYSIAKASLGNISGLGTFEYPYQSTVTGNEFNGGDADVTYTLFRDLVAVSNPDINNFSVGEYNYKFNSTEGENYSASELDTGVLNITKNNSYFLNITGTSPITYGTSGDFEGVGCPSQLTCNLLRNSTYDSWVTTSNPDTSVLSAVLHNYVYNSSGNENYSGKQFFKNLTINQATGSGNLYLDHEQSNLSVVNNSNVEINGTSSVQGDLLLYVDDSLWNTNGTIYNQSTFTIIEYIPINLTYLGNVNFTAFSNLLYLNITENVTTPSSPGGGGRAGSAGNDTVGSDFGDVYDIEFICFKSLNFVQLNTIGNVLDYEESELESFKNALSLEMGQSIAIEDLRPFVDNYSGNCIKEEAIEQSPLNFTLIILAILIILISLTLYYYRKEVLLAIKRSKRKTQKV